MADAWEAIETTTLSGTSTGVTFSSLTTDYQHLMIKMIVRTDLNTTPGYDYVGVKFNGTANDWDVLAAYGFNVALAGDNELNIATGKVRAAACDPIDSSTFGQMEVVIPNYQSTNQFHGFNSIGGTSSVSNGYTQFAGSTWHASTAAVTSVTLEPGAGTNFVAGSIFTIYGLRGS